MNVGVKMQMSDVFHHHGHFTGIAEMDDKKHIR